MTSAGIDIGAKATKVVILKDGQVLSRHMVLAGFDTDESAKQALGEALRQASLSRDDLEHITATGTGRKQASFAHHRLTEVAAAARGTHFLLPSVRTIIDVGAEEGRSVGRQEGVYWHRARCGPICCVFREPIDKSRRQMSNIPRQRCLKWSING